MFSGGLIAQNARDDADKNYEMALNKQRSAQVNLGSAQAAIAKAEAQLQQQQAIVARAEEDLKNATIVSPIEGVVLSRDIEVGGRGQLHSHAGRGSHADHDAGRFG